MGTMVSSYHLSAHFFPGIYAQDDEGNYEEGEVEFQDVNGYYAGGPVVRLA